MLNIFGKVPHDFTPKYFIFYFLVQYFSVTSLTLLFPICQGLSFDTPYWGVSKVSHTKNYKTQNICKVFNQKKKYERALPKYSYIHMELT